MYVKMLSCKIQTVLAKDIKEGQEWHGAIWRHQGLLLDSVGLGVDLDEAQLVNRCLLS